jgi:hypothetical protein
LLFLAACVALWFPGLGHFAALGFPSCIDDMEQAHNKIKVGMTRDEVRSLLGPPGRQGNNEWRYYNTIFVTDCILEINFGPDGRVTERHWWAD